MSKFSSTERTTGTKSFIESEQCLKICWMIQALPMGVVTIYFTWGMMYLITEGIPITLDFFIVIAIWIMGCGFCVQAATFPRLWFGSTVMLANMVYESVVCSIATLRYTPMIVKREDLVWIIGVMVITTLSVDVLTLRSVLVWRNGVTKPGGEKEVGMMML